MGICLGRWRRGVRIARRFFHRRMFYLPQGDRVTGLIIEQDGVGAALPDKVLPWECGGGLCDD